MLSKESTVVGEIGSGRGLQGHIVVYLNEEFSYLKFISKRWVFVHFEQKPVPFYVLESKHLGENKWELLLNSISSREAAAELRGRSIAVLNNELPGKSYEEENLIGFRLFNANGQEIGEITDQQLSAGQILLSIRKGDTDYLIPFHEDLLVKIDEPAREIHLDLPEGLLDL